MTIFMAIVGLGAGWLTSNSVHISDQYWTNAGVLAIGGTVVALLLDFFFVSPIRLWRRAEGELEKHKSEASNSPSVVHLAKGNQTINYNFFNAAEAVRFLAGTAGGAPMIGDETYTPPSQTVHDKSHRVKGHADAITPQLSLRLPSETLQTASEESLGPT